VLVLGDTDTLPDVLQLTGPTPLLILHEVNALLPCVEL